MASDFAVGGACYCGLTALGECEESALVALPLPPRMVTGSERYSQRLRFLRDVFGYLCDLVVRTKRYAMADHVIQEADAVGLDRTDSEGCLLAILLGTANP
jgi:hypothetical protein